MKVNRRQFVNHISLSSLLLLGGCKFTHSRDAKPIIRLSLDEHVSKVQQQSTYTFPAGFLEGAPGHNFIKTPHILQYEDETLALTIKDAGGLPSLLTTIGYTIRLDSTKPEAVIEHLSVHVAPEYLDVNRGIEVARQLHDNLLTQGFQIEALPMKARYDAIWENLPAQIDSFEDLKNAFLNSSLFMKTAGFAFQKNNLRLELVMRNARRRWGSLTDKSDRSYMPSIERAHRESNTMSGNDLLEEKAYSLELNIGPTSERRSQRMRSLKNLQ